MSDVSFAVIGVHCLLGVIVDRHVIEDALAQVVLPHGGYFSGLQLHYENAVLGVDRFDYASSCSRPLVSNNSLNAVISEFRNFEELFDSQIPEPCISEYSKVSGNRSSGFVELLVKSILQSGHLRNGVRMLRRGYLFSQLFAG